jgi:hypothetical protein
MYDLSNRQGLKRVSFCKFVSSRTATPTPFHDWAVISYHSPLIEVISSFPLTTVWNSIILIHEPMSSKICNCMLHCLILHIFALTHARALTIPTLDESEACKYYVSPFTLNRVIKVRKRAQLHNYVPATAAHTI